MSRVQLEITLGTIMVLVTSIIILVYGLDENARMARYDTEYRARDIEVGAQLFDTNCTGCHGKQGEGVPGLCPPLNDKNFFVNRLKEVGWSGSLDDYIVATVSGGRLVSTRPDKYAGQGKPAMPAWSDEFGGPLRVDQIRSIASFVMNWQSTAPDRSIVTAPAGPPVGKDITVALPAGDVSRGQGVANAQGCVACHITTTTGPAWNAASGQPAIGTRATTRFTESGYTGKATTAEQYLFESIVDSPAYVVPGFQPVMPQDYGDKLTAQDLADVIAYLLTLK
jgi:mono/diheme cytochrome c family protein